MKSVTGGLFTCMTTPPHPTSQVYRVKGKGWFCEEHKYDFEGETE